MRPTSRSIGNGLAWVVIFGLIGLAAAVVRMFGFPGVFCLGVLTALICTKGELAEEGSRARYRSPGPQSPELRAAEAEERARELSPLRYYRRCGFVLVAVGVVGTAVQFLR